MSKELGEYKALILKKQSLLKELAEVMGKMRIMETPEPEKSFQEKLQNELKKK